MKPEITINNEFSPSSLALAKAQELRPYLEVLLENNQHRGYSFPEAFMNVPFDQPDEHFQNIEGRYSDPLFEAGIIAGIGGSNLGTCAIYSALKPSKKLYYADTVDEHLLLEIITQIKQIYARGKRVVIFMVSKSGSTTEPIAAFGVLLKELQELDASWQECVAVITTKDSELDNYAQEKNFAVAYFPNQVGGRYSVLTNVGLIPLAFAGINIQELLTGARQATEDSLDLNIQDNMVAGLAGTLFNHLAQRKTIYNFFTFTQVLIQTGLWHRQLMAESLGKMGKGMYPVVSRGTVDLHSTLQIYMDGPRNDFTAFYYLKSPLSGLGVPQDLDLDSLVEHIEGHSIHEINTIILQAVKTSYQEAGLPFADFALERLDEHSLGYLMQFEMFKVVYLGKLLDINPFDQPGVEAYKHITRSLLAQS